jgi:hypothetical protein
MACDGRTAERAYELPSADVDCHLTAHQWVTPRNVGKNITPQPTGLALAALAVAVQSLSGLQIGHS